MSRFIEKALVLIDWLSPAIEIESRENRRRVRSIVAATLIGCVILTTTSISTLVLGLDRDVAYVNFAWAAAILVLLGAARWFRSPGLLANSLVAIAFSHTLLLSALAGGRNVGALFAFSVFPLVAVLLAGWRSGLIFTVLAAGAVVLTPWIPIDTLAPAYAGQPPVPAELVRDALNVVFAVGVLTALYDAVRGATLRDAETSGAQAQLVAERQRNLVELSRRLQGTTSADFDAELERAMELAARLAGANRTVLRLIDGGRYAGRYSFGEDAAVPSEAFEEVRSASRAFTWTAEQIRAGRISQVRRLQELPAEAEAERAYLARRGVVSWLCVPIRAGSTPVGYQSFECTDHEKTWDEEETAALRLMTELLAAAVQRHRTEQALRESETKFAIAFRDHPDAMVISDLETDEIVECNDGWLKHMERSTREEVIGKRIWEFEFQFPEEHREAIRQSLHEHGRTSAIEVPVVGSEGELRTLLISSTRIDIGRRHCVLSNVHDLTERKHLEQQLLHAQKMEAVGRLAGGVAHDYNNMLTVISGYSASLVEELDGEQREDAREIHQAARRSADLTRQLLAFSRRQVLQTEVLDPNGLISGLETMLRPLIGESVQLRIELDPAPGLVSTDRGQLEQAIVNLVVNARDAMREGGIVTVQTAKTLHAGNGASGLPPELSAGAYVVISVSDEGDGMDPEVAEHVMEPFFTTKPEGQGTGLGLPMVHGLAQQCGGTLVLESETGRGTRASIYLPGADAKSTGAVEAREPRMTTRSAATYRVLLAEDEGTVRRLAARTLRAAGYDVVEVENGEQAWRRALAEGDAIDVVLSDVVMPELSGTELALRLRGERPDLPIVLMSGYLDAEAGQPIPDDVVLLLKPFEPASLCETVSRAIKDKEEAMPAVS